MSVESRCRDYYREVLRFSKALNLTAIKEEKAFFERFISPSLAVADLVPESGRLLDIGSGMGVPGIPVLIARPGIHGVLVERRKKRAEFLRHVGRQLKLDVEVFDADINDLPPLGIDIFTARAVTRVDALLAMCARHANPDSVAVLPVPRASQRSESPLWRFIDATTVEAGEQQLIQRYRFVGEVSRET